MISGVSRPAPRSGDPYSQTRPSTNVGRKKRNTCTAIKKKTASRNVSPLQEKQTDIPKRRVAHRTEENRTKHTPDTTQTEPSPTDSNSSGRAAKPSTSRGSRTTYRGTKSKRKSAERRVAEPICKAQTFTVSISRGATFTGRRGRDSTSTTSAGTTYTRPTIARQTCTGPICTGSSSVLIATQQNNMIIKGSTSLHSTNSSRRGKKAHRIQKQYSDHIYKRFQRTTLLDVAAGKTTACYSENDETAADEYSMDIKEGTQRNNIQPDHPKETDPSMNMNMNTSQVFTAGALRQNITYSVEHACSNIANKSQPSLPKLVHSKTKSQTARQAALFARLATPKGFPVVPRERPTIKHVWRTCSGQASHPVAQQPQKAESAIFVNEKNSNSTRIIIHNRKRLIRTPRVNIKYIASYAPNEEQHNQVTTPNNSTAIDPDTTESISLLQELDTDKNIPKDTRPVKAALSAISTRTESAALSTSPTRTESAALSTSSTRTKSAALSASSARTESAALSASSTRTESAALSTSSTRTDSAALSASSTRTESAALSTSYTTAESAALIETDDDMVVSGTSESQGTLAIVSKSSDKAIDKAEPLPPSDKSHQSPPSNQKKVSKHLNPQSEMPIPSNKVSKSMNAHSKVSNPQNKGSVSMNTQSKLSTPRTKLFESMNTESKVSRHVTKASDSSNHKFKIDSPLFSRSNPLNRLLTLRVPPPGQTLSGHKVSERKYGWTLRASSVNAPRHALSPKLSPRVRFKSNDLIVAKPAGKIFNHQIKDRLFLLTNIKDKAAVFQNICVKSRVNMKSVKQTRTEKEAFSTKPSSKQTRSNIPLRSGKPHDPSASSETTPAPTQPCLGKIPPSQTSPYKLSKNIRGSTCQIESEILPNILGKQLVPAQRALVPCD